LADAETTPDKSKVPKKKVSPEQKRNPIKSSNSSGASGALRRPSLNEILGKVAAAQEEVNRVVGAGGRVGKKESVDKTPVRDKNSGSGEGISGSKISRGGKQIDLDDNEIFAMSSGSDNDGDDVGGPKEVDDLEKTLDTWLSRQKKQANAQSARHAVDDVLSESKVLRERREQRRKLLGEERDWLTEGYDVGSAEEVVEDLVVVSAASRLARDDSRTNIEEVEDGEVAEMQCMLADVLMAKSARGDVEGGSNDDDDEGYGYGAEEVDEEDGADGSFDYDDEEFR
jgi:hypothetical protein